MLRSSWFFVSLLVTDAFVLQLLRQEPPPIPAPIPVDPAFMRLMMFYMPLASMFLAFRSVNMMMKTSILMQTMSSMQSVTQTPRFINGLLDRCVKGNMALVGRMAQNSCALKLLCELTVEQRISRQDRRFSRRMNVRKQNEYDEIINKLINLNVIESAESENFCERRYRGCPYCIEDISQLLVRPRNSWSRWRTSQTEQSFTDIPFIIDEDDCYYLIL